MPVLIAVRRLVRERARNRCDYCQCSAEFSPGPFSVEHILPEARGGGSETENLAFACMGCNGHKSDATTAPDPVTGENVPLFHPRDQQWPDHFVWSEGFLQVEGLTSTGRASVARLQLNRTEVVNLRWVLLGYGFHPPEETTHPPD
jgi:hypothetical protein